jgi:catechol O-methyltransferase
MCPHKGAFISQITAELKPALMIEPGRYIGYSTIPFGNADRSGGGKEYISLEINPQTAAVASI